MTSPPRTLCRGSAGRPSTVARPDRTHNASRLRENSGNNFASAWSNLRPAQAAGAVIVSGPEAGASRL